MAIAWHCRSIACWKARKFQSRAPACTGKGRLTPNSASVQASPIRPSWCRRARSTCWRRLWRSQTLGTASALPCRHALSCCVHSRVPIMPLAEQWTLHPHLSGVSQLKASTPRQHGMGRPLLTQIAGGVICAEVTPCQCAPDGVDTTLCRPAHMTSGARWARHWPCRTVRRRRCAPRAACWWRCSSAARPMRWPPPAMVRSWRRQPQLLHASVWFAGMRCQRML